MLPISAPADGETAAAAESAAETEATPISEETLEEEDTTETEKSELAYAVIRFNCTPEETEIFVYEKTAYEQAEIDNTEAEEDGAYRLTCGTYDYTAACKGYTGICEELVIEKADTETGEEEVINVVFASVAESDEKVKSYCQHRSGS